MYLPGAAGSIIGTQSIEKAPIHSNIITSTLHTTSNSNIYTHSSCNISTYSIRYKSKSNNNAKICTKQKFAQSSGNVQIETATLTSSSSRSSNYTVTIIFTPQQWQDVNFYTLITTFSYKQRQPHCTQRQQYEHCSSSSMVIITMIGKNYT